MSEPEVTSKTVKRQRKVHPNAWRYPDRHNTEHLRAVTTYMSIREHGAGVSDKTREFLASLLVGDEIGFDTHQHVVESVSSEGVTTNRGEFSLEEVDFCVQIGYAEILKRDGKFYGVDESEDITFTIKDYTKPTST